MRSLYPLRIVINQ